MKKTLVLFSILALMTSMSTAQEGLHLNAIGGGLGFVKAEGIDGSIGFQAHADLGEVVENIVVFPSLTYWSKSEGAGNLSVDYSQFAINADGRYYFPSESNMAFFGGAGLGLIFHSATVLGFSSSTTRIGLNLFGGLDMPISEKLDFTAEGRFVISDGNLFRILAGITYQMGE